MAYLRQILARCDVRACWERPVVELVDIHGVPYGRYCEAHGERRLKTLEAAEAANQRLHHTRTPR